MSTATLPDGASMSLTYIRDLERRVASAIIEAHHRLWPSGLNGTYTVVHINGKAKVKFDFPPVKEKGYAD